MKSSNICHSILRSTYYRAFLASFLVLCWGWIAQAETLLTCSGMPGGDRHYRGFYIPSYPGNTMDSARLEFSSNDPGDYSVSLVVRANSYDGAILGTSSASFSLAGSYPQNTPVTFNFPSVPIPKGSRVCFSMELTASPDDLLFYSVANLTDGCSEVVQTTGTTPPLSTFRRNGVNLVITGQDTLIVGTGESIQAAINAASPGDTVTVGAGTFVEDLTLRSEVSVQGAGYNQTTLQGTGSGTVVSALNVINSEFKGFTITGSGTGTADAGVHIRGGSLMLNNNRVRGNLDGIRITSGSSAIIQNNIVEENGNARDTSLDYGIICLSSKPLIVNNVVANNDGVGIYMAWAESTGAQVINNTVAGNQSRGIWCYNQADVTIKNNIFVENSTGISASHGAAPLISFNNLWNNRWNNYDAQSEGIAAPGLGDIEEDPQFDTSFDPPYALLEGSPCIDAGDPAPLFNDRDGSRNDMGAFGGPSGLIPGLFTPVTSGFLFNNIGKIPTSEITQSGPLTGLVNVSPGVATALSLYPYKDAPFGGRLWLHGLFGSSDNFITHYKVFAAKWTGATPPDLADFEPLTDPLSKVKYTVNPSGTVTASLENVGPDAEGLYLRTDRPGSGYWAHPDLKLIWNTHAEENGRYDLICKGYLNFFGSMIPWPLPTNELSRITVHVDNRRVTAEIVSVRDQYGNVIPECGLIPVGTDTEDIQFEITASHPGGFLRNYSLQALYGRNRNGGIITSDQYVGSNDGARPTWTGVLNQIVGSSPAHTSGTLVPWTNCAYQFRLRAWARTTDGFKHIYGGAFSDHYFINLGAPVNTTCSADLNGDGNVDGEDLMIFGSQFGQTNCVVAPLAP